MTVSKRTRFEVLRRDNHTCRYCGAKAPDVTLHVDHVVPQALGGTDEPTNLVTACEDCNLGKASSVPDQQLVDDVDEMAAKWTLARQQAAAAKAVEDAARDKILREFLDTWSDWDKDLSYLPDDWARSVGWWLDDGLSMDQIIDAYFIAISKRNISNAHVFRYMAGVCRNMVADLDQRTRDQLKKMDGDA